MIVNRSKIQKLNAFTIMEVTVAMIIAAIAIMISYTIYNIISKGYLDFTHKNQELGVLMELDHLLQRDFNEADLIVSVSGGLSVRKRENNILYQFRPEEIIRKSTIVDTFKVSVVKRSVAFQGLPVQQDLMDDRHESTANRAALIERSRVDEFNLLIRFQQRPLSYTYRKQYSSINLIHRKENAIY